MRGRTNAEPNIGVQLNATIDTYEVATGENILAGDFVKRYEYAVNQLDNSTVADYQSNMYSPIYKPPIFFRLSDGKFVCSNIIYEKDENNEYSIAYTAVNSVPNGDFVKELGDDTFVGFSIGGKSSAGYGIYSSYAKYNVNEHTISTRTATTNVKTWTNVTQQPDTMYLYIIDKGNNTFKVAVSYAIVISSQTRNTVDVFDVVLSGSDYTDYAISISNLNSTTNLGVAQAFVKISNNEDYLIMATNRVIRLNNNVFSDTHSFSYPSMIYTPFSKYLAKNIAEDGMVDLLYWTRTGTTASNYVYYLKRIRYYFPVDSWDYNSYDIENVVDDVYGSITRYMGTLNGKDIYITRKSRNSSSIVPFTIDATTGELSVGDAVGLNELYVSESTTNFIYSSIVNNDIIMIFGNVSNVGTQLCEFTYNNGVFTSIGDNVKIVKKITTQEYIMGVAKQSGTAGDTIEVYIPSTSY